MIRRLEFALAWAWTPWREQQRRPRVFHENKSRGSDDFSATVEGSERRFRAHDARAQGHFRMGCVRSLADSYQGHAGSSRPPHAARVSIATSAADVIP